VLGSISAYYTVNIQDIQNTPYSHCHQTYCTSQISPNMTAANNDLSGKLALITGASGGYVLPSSFFFKNTLLTNLPFRIGSAIAKSLYLQNVSLALTYSASPDAILALETSLSLLRPESPSPTISTHKVDVSSPADITRLFTSIAQLHGQAGPDILISNAGHGKRVPEIEDITLEEFDYTISVNLRAAFVLCKGSIPFMKERGWGRVVFVSSLAAHGGGINGCQ